MIDYVSVYITDIEEAAGFYNAVLATLSYKQYAKYSDIIAYGKGNINFILTLSNTHYCPQHSNPIHIAFSAANMQQVDDFHNTALIHGGKTERKPAFREHPCGEVYTTGVQDIFGYKLEAVYKYPKG